MSQNAKQGSEIEKIMTVFFKDNPQKLEVCEPHIYIMKLKKILKSSRSILLNVFIKVGTLMSIMILEMIWKREAQLTFAF